MQGVRSFIKRILPRKLYRALLIPYHLLWAFSSALYYGFPAKKLTVIAVTGTKGKSSVTEMLTAILEEAGYTVAVSSTIHFKNGKETRPNLFKMTLPGRGFIQRLLAQALENGATHAVIEVTSEAALQYRHVFLYLDALVFTNLEKEHLESHGGMERYFAAKMRIGKTLSHSPKRPRAVVANEESEYGKRFLTLPVERSFPFKTTDALHLTLLEKGVSFDFESVRITTPHPGEFSVRNALASIKTASFLGVSVATSAKALSKLSVISGRAECIEEGQDFLAIVDYAHTPDSLRALYEAYPNHRKICVLGNTGGGRDTWKRPEMGSIAQKYCTEVILTNEDPYDEDPKKILEDMVHGMETRPKVILDRREAITEALKSAQVQTKSASNPLAVLVTGKGTDPYIMEAQGVRTPWSDADVIREELRKLST
jgi:UDP-N-acetylmuramoyl-L-alanyl-D-glutamate--2,6-diaminopimelate ligase